MIYDWIRAIFGIVILFIALGSLFAGFNQANLAWGKIKPTRKTLAGFLGPFHFLVPGMYRESAMGHWAQCAIYLLIFLACFAILAFLGFVDDGSFDMGAMNS